MALYDVYSARCPLYCMVTASSRVDTIHIVRLQAQQHDVQMRDRVRRVFWAVAAIASLRPDVCRKPTFACLSYKPSLTVRRQGSCEQPDLNNAIHEHEQTSIGDFTGVHRVYIQP